MMPCPSLPVVRMRPADVITMPPVTGNARLPLEMPRDQSPSVTMSPVEKMLTLPKALLPTMPCASVPVVLIVAADLIVMRPDWVTTLMPAELLPVVVSTPAALTVVENPEPLAATIAAAEIPLVVMLPVDRTVMAPDELALMPDELSFVVMIVPCEAMSMLPEVLAPEMPLELVPAVVMSPVEEMVTLPKLLLATMPLAKFPLVLIVADEVMPAVPSWVPTLMPDELSPVVVSAPRALSVALILYGAPSVIAGAELPSVEMRPEKLTVTGPPPGAPLPANTPTLVSPVMTMAKAPVSMFNSTAPLLLKRMPYVGTLIAGAMSVVRLLTLRTV